MWAMVCEICRGREFVKRGDEFVCERCGVRYGVGEARRLVRDYAFERSREQRVANHCELAREALGAGRAFEAEVHANKALELDVSSFEARLLKARAVSRQVLAGEYGLHEALRYYAWALEVCPQGRREELSKEIDRMLAG